MGLRMGTTVGPKVALIRAAVWLVSSGLFFSVASAKIVDLRFEGREVSGWRYAQAAFWVLMIGFWIYQGWQSLQAFRAGQR